MPLKIQKDLVNSCHAALSYCSDRGFVRKADFTAHKFYITYILHHFLAIYVDSTDSFFLLLEGRYEIS